MSGTRITDQQVRLYMSKRKHHSQEIAAAKAGISVRSARRIERDALLPSQKPRRYWRSRPDPFADVWDTEVVPMLANAPELQAVTILRKPQDDHPGEYPDSTRRHSSDACGTGGRCRAHRRKSSSRNCMNPVHVACPTLLTGPNCE